MWEEEFDVETSDKLEALLEQLKEIPKHRLTMLNTPRYAQALTSIRQIVSMIKDDCPDAEVEVKFDDLTGSSLCLKVIADEFNVYKIRDFVTAIEPANTMCVIPRLDERLEIGFTYEDAQVAMPPVDTEG